MLNDATCFKQIYLVTGYTDLRSGIDRLAGIIETQTGIDPFSPDTLYLFCGRKADRIKGLVWEKDGYLLLYKRLAAGQYQWPRNAAEVRVLTPTAIPLANGRAYHNPEEVCKAGITGVCYISFVQNRENISCFLHV